MFSFPFSPSFVYFSFFFIKRTFSQGKNSIVFSEATSDGSFTPPPPRKALHSRNIFRMKSASSHKVESFAVIGGKEIFEDQK